MMIKTSVLFTFRLVLCNKLQNTNNHLLGHGMAAPTFKNIHSTKGGGTVEDPMVRSISKLKSPPHPLNV